MKILFLDIESSPNTAHVWGLWQQNVGLSQLMESSYTMCWAAKWYQEEEIFFDSVFQSKPRHMLKGIHKLLSEADAVVHYNGTKFDIPTLNKEFLLHGYTPPAPYKQTDLLRVARGQFKFPSNKLDYVAQALGLGKKTAHEGHELWVKCMNDDPVAWEKMEEYNKNDVVLLEKVYGKLLPWIKNHANHSIYADALICPNCGSDTYQKRGFSYTSRCKYQRYQCLGCGGWFKGGPTLAAGVNDKFTSLSS